MIKYIKKLFDYIVVVRAFSHVISYCVTGTSRNERVTIKPNNK